MIPGSDFKSLSIKSSVVFGLWCIVVLFISSVTIVQTIQEGTPINVFGIITYEFVCLLPWIICTPALIWVARTYRFDNDGWYKSIGVHLVAAFVVFSMHCLVQSGAVSYFYDLAFSWAYIKRDFIGFLDMRVILYIGVLLAVYTIDFQEKNRETRLRKSRLKADLNTAKFQALINQIQPDFLVNTIDAIKGKLDENLEEAEEILNDFSDLLRIMLNSVSREEAIVEQDLKSYDLYVNVLSKRLSTTIEKKITIDPNCYQALVPSFLLLIPLFEQLILSPEFRITDIEVIEYKVEKMGDSIELGINLRGNQLSVHNMSGFFQKSGIPKIIKSLKIRYGEDVRFQTSSDESMIHFGLKMPLIIQGVSLAVAE